MDAPDTSAETNPPMATAEKRNGGAVIPHRAKWHQRLVATLIFILVRTLAATVRFKLDDQCGIFSEVPKEKLIFAIWHNRLALSLVMYRKYVQRRQPSRRIAGMVSASRDGGSDAAHRLHQEIRAHILRQYETAGQWSIMVQIYANLEGLGRKLSSVGIIKTPQDLHAFARSFSLNQPLFSFVDVGSGKERADHKIKGEWTTSMRLPNFPGPT